jgi:VIT1/CCC1 family predicted Fe2+/Mn2+ transporter
LKASIGDVAFGMEDGVVSIAGLVFGVAASTSDTHVVLLAGGDCRLPPERSR